MTQKTTGWRSIFTLPRVYDAAQRALGAVRTRQRLADEYLMVEPEMAVLDIGCGPGDIIAHLPAVHYVGFDLSATYIESAKQRYGDRGTFHVGDVSAFDLPSDWKFDLVMALGVLHHLGDDASAALFATAHDALRPSGKLVTLDPTFSADQGRMARFVISRDRGQGVRSPDAYETLARGVFRSVDVAVHDDFLRIPFTHAVLTCRP